MQENKQETWLFTIQRKEVEDVSQFIINQQLGQKKIPLYGPVTRRTIAELKKKYPFDKLEKPVHNALVKFIAQVVGEAHVWR